MGFGEAIKTVLGKYATFAGRAPRSEYWWWVLFVFILMICLQIVDGLLIGPMLGFEPFEPNAGQPLSLIVTLGLLIPNLAVGVRRLHDLDKSGWWLLLAFVPIVGALVLLYWFVQPGTEGSNDHGTDPLA